MSSPATLDIESATSSRKSSKEKSPDDQEQIARFASAVSTKKILRDFPRHSCDPNSQTEIDKQRKLEYYNALDRNEKAVLERLKAWTKHEAEPFSVHKLLTAHKKDAPYRDELTSLVKHYFPPRGETVVEVYDFGDDRAVRTEIRLGDIELAFESKPEWASVRWIHAPLGIGLFHSSVEDLYLKSGSKSIGREFITAGRGGWPYLETEILNVRSIENIADLRYVSGLSKNREVSKDLDLALWQGDRNPTLRPDVEWRAGHMGTVPSYWESVISDIPYQLSDGSALPMNSPLSGTRTSKRDADRQSLASHPFFEKAQLARNPFRAFHRNDGYLLTLSPAVGIDYLDKDMAKYLGNSTRCLYDNEQISAVAHLFHHFENTGTSTWHQKSVEWLLVYIISEIAGTPHNIRKGFNCPSVMDAYDSIVQELKERRYEPWRRNESPKLVRAYLACIDELTTLGSIFAKKIDLFTRMETDCKRFETEDAAAGASVNNPEGETALERIHFALQTCKEARDHTQRLIVDLTESVNTLFQLRSIEQNELAIVADSQNKAIFLFTGVTIVFMPLSFFTSYFGMNLKGVGDTDRGETYFWQVCGTISFIIIGLTAMFAFRRQLFSRYRRMDANEYMLRT